MTRVVLSEEKFGARPICKLNGCFFVPEICVCLSVGCGRVCLRPFWSRAHAATENLGGVVAVAVRTRPASAVPVVPRRPQTSKKREGLQTLLRYNTMNYRFTDWERLPLPPLR